MTDPREVLGVPPDASARDIRRAHARLTEQIVAAHAPDGLVALLADARDAALAGAALTVPSAPTLLGLSLGLSSAPAQEDVRHAWRTVAAATHPDSGGSAGLFRVVSDAHDELTGRHLRRRFRTPRWTDDRPPPAKPPPRGPFRAPDPADRITQRRGQALADLGVGVGVVVGIGFAATVPLVLWRQTGMPVAGAIVLLTTIASRPVLHDAARALVRLWGMRRTIADREAPDRFLAERTLDAPVDRVEHARLYADYLRWCHARGAKGLSVWRFVEELRSYGLLYVHGSGSDTARWVGLRLRERKST